MAAVHSLGLHEPSALSYLVSEGLLPINPSTSSYKWSYQQVLEGSHCVIDEVLEITNCVVWSRNGLVQRVFNLDIEGETITHAFTTHFAQHVDSLDKSTSESKIPTSKESALCVILKTQAHIFLLSGDTHVVPLSFEIEKAFPSAYGFFLQRFVSPKHLEDGSQTTANVSAGKTLSQSRADKQTPTGNETDSAPGGPRLPRTFAFPELLSEVSLVVSGSVRRNEHMETCPILGCEEDIIYVSTNDELEELQIVNSDQIHLAITLNIKEKTLSLWQVVYKHVNKDDLTSQKPQKPNPSKRKSSNVYGRQTGAATPTVRGPGTFRESVGGLSQSVPEVFAASQNLQVSQGDLAAQLGPEFGQVGVQTRSARRVSSMLARTDLGGANDRSAFNEMVSGTFGRKSLGRSIRRGESLGGFSDRQSFGVRRRSSFQAASSVYSDGTSFLDIPASHLLDDGTVPSSMDTLDNAMTINANSKVPRGVAFMKLKSLAYEVPGTSQDHSKFLKVMTLLAPDRSTADDRRSRIISVCIMDTCKQEMTIVNIAAKTSLSATRYKMNRVAYDLKAVEVQRGHSIVDACSVIDGFAKRLLILTQTREGRSVLHLEAPWSISYRINLPTQFRVFDSSGTTRGNSPASRRDTGIHRIIPDSEIDIGGLRPCESRDQVLAVDAEQRYHRVRFRLVPSHHLTRKVLQLCNFVLAPEFYDSLLVAWWEVKRWIELQGPDPNLEWTALIVTLFMLAVPFIGNIQNRPAQGPKRKKTVLPRSSSGTTVDQSHWNLMVELERDAKCTKSSSWAWTEPEIKRNVEPKSPSKHLRNTSTDNIDDKRTDAFIIRCVNLARDFLQSPAGENAIGPEGYLPTAVNKDRVSRRTALASIVVGLHLLREESKLHEISISKRDTWSDQLAVVIAQISSWLQWMEWRVEPGRYYYTEIQSPLLWQMESSVIDNLETPAQPFPPPSIFDHIAHSMSNSEVPRFPSLLDLISQTKAVTQSHPLWKQAVRITPRLFGIVEFMSQMNRKRRPRSIIKHMLSCGIDKQVLETIPAGIATVFHQAIVIVRGQPPLGWSDEAKLLLGRADLDAIEKFEDSKQSLAHVNHVHDAVRDYRTISNNALDSESTSRWDALPELDRQAITRLIFREDRRFQEASKLVNQTRPPIVECTPEPGWSEADLLEAQKELAVHVTKRTLSLSAGRAMMHYSARIPLLTERVPIPAFSLQCVMKTPGSSDGSQPMTLSAEKALFTEDKVCWAFFHNGASAGLMISKDVRWIDTSWIIYNKPPELTNRHAGFLLALGLNGHLKSLAKWVAFKYLTPKHTMTSVGLLLGLAASYLGTMDTLIARLLSVHVTRLLPVGAAELNLSPLTQTTGLMGVGLLYCNSQHRRMSEIMLSEIENSDSEEKSGDEPILRDEGYRLAAGFSLGLINLGQGRGLHSLHDMAVVERLLTIAIGTKNVNHVHVLDRATAGAVVAVAFIFMKTNDESVAKKIDVPDTAHQFDYIRPDIFLLRTLARHLIMWNSVTPTRDFIRASLPPTFRQRADLSTTKRLSTDDLSFFNVIAGICFAIALRFAGSHRHDVRDLLVTYLDQFLRLIRLPALNYDARVTLNGARNCLDVVALSCATVMAGSGDIVVMRRLRALHGRTDKETPFGSHLAAHMALGVLYLSGGTATLGTSNLAIASLVISLYPLFPVDVLDNRSHLQALRHLWVLAVENRCLTARDVETQQIIGDIAAEIQLTDGTIQELKTPGLLPPFETIRKVSFKHDNYWPIEIDLDSPAKPSNGNPHTLKSSDKISQHLLRDTIKSAGTGLKISLQRRAAYEKPATDTFFAELQALDESRGVPSVDPNAASNEKWRQIHGYGSSSDAVQAKNPFDWVFSLDAFKNLDFAEKALVLGDADPVSRSAGVNKLLDETVVDFTLNFEFGCLGLDADDGDVDGESGGDGEDSKKVLPGRKVDKDKLWQLRLLFGWIEKWEREDGEDGDGVAGGGGGGGGSSEKNTGMTSGRWIKQEVIEQLKWRVWKMAGGFDKGTRR